MYLPVLAGPFQSAECQLAKHLQPVKDGNLSVATSDVWNLRLTFAWLADLHAASVWKEVDWANALTVDISLNLTAANCIVSYSKQ